MSNDESGKHNLTDLIIDTTPKRFTGFLTRSIIAVVVTNANVVRRSINRSTRYPWIRVIVLEMERII
jgi:hypothetical protein